MKKFMMISLAVLNCIFVFCGCADNSGNHPMLKKAAQSLRMGEYRNAELCYKKFLAQHPNNSGVHLSLANLYDEHLEEYLLAVYHYKEVLRLSPDAGAETVKNIEGFIKRCEQRYLQKGKTVKKVFLTDEQEIQRMTAAYKKNLAEQQKKAETELARLKKEAELAKKQELAEKQIQDSPKESKTEIKKDGKIHEVKAAEKKVEKQLSETLIADSAETVKNTADKVSEKIIPDTPAAAEKIQTDSGIEVKKVQEKPTQTVINDFSKLPAMQMEKKAEKTTPEAETVKEYKVKRGDTFSHLSRKFYGSVRYYKQLMKYNNISTPNGLRVGKTIKVPPLQVLKGE